MPFRRTVLKELLPPMKRKTALLASLSCVTKGRESRRSMLHGKITLNECHLFTWLSPSIISVTKAND